VYGDKHSNFTEADATKLRKNPAHVMVFIFRGVFSWLPKMHENVYRARLATAHTSTAARKLPFSKFLRTPHREGVAMLGTAEQKVGSARPIVRKTSLVLPNFMVARNMRYRNWLAQAASIGSVSWWFASCQGDFCGFFVGII
jgi:hypothetical protein